MKTILISGGAGFVGSHLAEKYVKEGYLVKVLDDFSTGRVNNIRELFNYKNFKLIKGDITDKRLVNDAVRGVDVVLHLAAQVHVDKSIIDAERTFQVNAQGTMNVLEAVLQNDVELLVYASSSEVYGSAQQVPMNENHPLSPASPYAASKVAADRMCFAYWNTYKLPVVIMRSFNTYGIRQLDSGYAAVIPLFIKRAIQGLSPIIYGNGCLPAGEKVFGNPILKNIEEIQIGDHVLGKDNFVKVTNKFMREYEGDLYTIKPMGMLPVRFTSEHPVYVMRLLKRRYTHKVNYITRPRHWIKYNTKGRYWFGWIRAEEMKVGDFVLLPKLNKVSKVMIDLKSYIPKRKYDKPQYRPRIVSFVVNEDWAWVLGLYLAEGWSGKKTVSWCLGRREVALRAELHNHLERLGLHWWEDSKPSASSSSETHISSTTLSAWLRGAFGSRAVNKHVPIEFFHLGKEETQAFIDGYSAGDGTTKKLYPSRRKYVASSSKDALYGIQLLLARLNNYGTIMWNDNWGGKCHSSGKLDFAEKPMSVRWFQSRDGIYTPVTDIKREYYKGMVYNLETEDHVYCVPFMVHNCQTRDYMYIKDAVNAYDLVLQSGDLFSGKAINFGTGKETSINRIAEIILSAVGSKMKLIHAAERPGEVSRLCCDMKFAKQELGFTPKYDIESGLKELVDWYQNGNHEGWGYA